MVSFIQIFSIANPLSGWFAAYILWQAKAGKNARLYGFLCVCSYNHKD
ncbi:hypothetical protein Mrub_2650 [Meiothermus ruber DSM 1279]|jgi:hypothetical protein|uniref:Uncharacterized protein n=1 Tax=Meiothermus ruber (strain ATCC 35948 / DSM 1279 / VKM B-1258 / 21) TaxID=504728 RepID=A0A806CN79_MEIRD|nr:hypothetical protein Mrub_2650 [Meiothermus ruber DSM 1279]GIW38738.1 MAG: hypothetical protein KatS3mg075_219 [Meiothermus sp.]